VSTNTDISPIHGAFVNQRRIARVLAKGCLFISADYRLLPEATGHDILEDVKDVFTFITKESTTFDDGKGGPVWKVKKDAIVVSGASSGGFCAYLAAIHAVPKPVSLLSIYGVGGDFFVSPNHFLHVFTNAQFPWPRYHSSSNQRILPRSGEDSVQINPSRPTKNLSTPFPQAVNLFQVFPSRSLDNLRRNVYSECSSTPST